MRRTILGGATAVALLTTQAGAATPTGAADGRPWRLAQATGSPVSSATGDVVPTRTGANQWRASKLVGVPILGPDNIVVGKITDVLMGKDGKSRFVIVGVGGVLGLGEKDVAIPFERVTFDDRPIALPANPVPTNNLAAGGPATVPVPAGAASLAAPDAPQQAIGYPDHGTIDLTADQLKAAPRFHLES